jgi:uncharacterized membrane protein HdeD (DUF308 family)
MDTLISQKHQTRRYSGAAQRKKNYTQMVGIALGAVMIVIGLAGILNPEFMGMHLSIMHSIVLSGTGALSMWSATHRNRRNSYYVALGLGIFYAIHAISGFVLGEPGNPGVGYAARDQTLLKVMPGFLELGTVDHTVHLFLTLFFMTAAYSWKKHHMGPARTGRHV